MATVLYLVLGSTGGEGQQRSRCAGAGQTVRAPPVCSRGPVTSIVPPAPPASLAGREGGLFFTSCRWQGSGFRRRWGGDSVRGMKKGSGSGLSRSTFPYTKHESTVFSGFGPVNNKRRFCTQEVTDMQCSLSVEGRRRRRRLKEVCAIFCVWCEGDLSHHLWLRLFFPPLSTGIMPFSSATNRP